MIRADEIRVIKKIMQIMVKTDVAEIAALEGKLSKARAGQGMDDVRVVDGKDTS